MLNSGHTLCSLYPFLTQATRNLPIVEGVIKVFDLCFTFFSAVRVELLRYRRTIFKNVISKIPHKFRVLGGGVGGGKAGERGIRNCASEFDHS